MFSNEAYYDTQKENNSTSVYFNTKLSSIKNNFGEAILKVVLSSVAGNYLNWYKLN